MGENEKGTDKKVVKPNLSSGQEVKKPVRPNLQSGGAPKKPALQGKNEGVTERTEITERTEGEIAKKKTEQSAKSNAQAENSEKGVQKARVEKEDKRNIQKKDKADTKTDAKTDAKRKKTSKDENETDNSETKTKKFPKKLIIGLGAGVAVFVVVLIVLSSVLKGNSKHITIATTEPAETEVSTEVSTEVTTEAKTEAVKVEKKEEKEYEQTPTDKVMNIGDVITIPMTVNTKLEGDEEYTDHYSYITFVMNDITIGYDNIITYIQKHNQKSVNVLNIDDKETFYNGREDSDLVMYDVVMSIPKDFPTQDTKNNKVFIQPKIELKITGTVEEDQLITNKYFYSVPAISDISDDMEELQAGKDYHFRFVCVMPTGIDKEVYNMTLVYDDKVEYRYDGFEIPASEKETTTETAESETETDIDSETEDESITETEIETETETETEVETDADSEVDTDIEETKSKTSKK